MSFLRSKQMGNTIDPANVLLGNKKKFVELRQVEVPSLRDPLRVEGLDLFLFGFF